jgi:hypothetical protein
VADTPDYRTPSPDAGHEAIRAPLAKAIDDLVAATSGVSDSYMLTDLIFSLLDGVMAAADKQATDLTALTARVTALEPPPPTPPTP